MKAWTLTAPKTLELVQTDPIPVESPDLIKVKIETSSLSYTDLRNYNSDGNIHYPQILGRHATGVVSEVFDSDNSFFAKSDKVVIDPVVPCLSCIECKTGNYKDCISKRIFGINCNGFHSDFVTLPIDMVHRIPNSIDFDSAVFTEYVSMAVNILDKIKIQKGDHVAILSANKIGNILAQLVSYYQGIPVVVDYNDNALSKLKDIGISYTFNPTDINRNIIDDIFDITGGRLCEKVVYLTNTPGNGSRALELCAKNGVLCISGFDVTPDTADFNIICQKQLSIFTVNSGCNSFPTAINLIANKAINFTSLIDGYVKFEDLDKVFASSSCDSLIYANPLIKYN